MIVHAKGEAAEVRRGAFFSLCVLRVRLGRETFIPGLSVDPLTPDRLHRMTSDPMTDPVTCEACLKALPVVHAHGKVLKSDRTGVETSSLCERKYHSGFTAAFRGDGSLHPLIGERTVTAQHPVSCRVCLTLMETKDPTMGLCIQCGVVTGRKATGGFVCFDCVDKFLKEDGRSRREREHLANLLGVIDGAPITSTYRSPEEKNERLKASTPPASKHTEYTVAYGNIAVHEDREVVENQALSLLGNALIALGPLPRRFRNTPGRKWLKEVCRRADGVEPMWTNADGSHRPAEILYGTYFPSPEQMKQGTAPERFVHPRDEKPQLEDLTDLLCD